MRYTTHYMKSITSHFFFYPALGSIAILLYVLYAAGPAAFLLACMLVVLEVTLSFDNAVINAKVLKDMSAKWQKRFLTWGILIAVVGTRVILPIAIVALIAGLAPWTVAIIAYQNPTEYAHMLESMHYVIASFGAAFLGMVALKYFFDDAKDVHWVHVLEKRFSKWGHIEAVEIATVLSLISLVTFVVPLHRAEILLASIVGIVIFIAMEGLTSGMGKSVQTVATSGLAGFLYLNVLDSAFSLDGVIGAFAITSDILVIAVGLGIGAYFVRSMTVYLVRQGSLSKIKYLEHGAHWAVLGLAVSMGASLITDIPEVITAGIGLAFILAAWWSSRE
jgi:uncharacterized protein